MNGPKRSRLPPSQHQNHRQTRVVFVRGLPPECSESELLALCCPFAVVEKSFMIPQKAQAFIQLPDVLSATNLINFYQTREAVIRGKRVYFEFSSREEITSKGDKHPLDSIHGGGFHDHRQEIQQVGYPIPTSTPNPIPNMNPNPIQQEPTYGRRGGPGVPSAILMVMVSKVEYDVTADILQQVFQKFGNVQRIITFWKNNECKALIQMESIEQAQAAQGALDGRDIYTGCNTLHIIFSRHTELKVRFNNERSRDFLDPTIPQGPPVGPGYLSGGPSGGGGSNGGPGFEEYDQEPPPYDVDPNGYGPPPPSSAPHYPPPGPAGPLGPPSYPPGPGPLPSYGDPRDDPYFSRNGPRDRRERSRSRDRIRTGAGMDYEARRARLPPHSTGRSMRSDAIRSPTLICSNMDSRLVTVDRVFTFFGCFGDVERIKIMFRKQDTALIQFVDEENAISALDHLDGVVVFGKKLRVDFSKHPNVSMPRGDVDRFELENTREFTNSPLHRYRRRSPSEAASIGPLLHVSGIPHDLQQNQNALIELFAQHGTVKTFHYLLKSANMAMVEMSSVDEAVMALLTLDNLTYPDSHMRVSFSKAYIPPPIHGGGFHSGGWNGRSDSPPRRDSNRERSRSRERHGGFNGGRGNHRVLPSGRY